MITEIIVGVLACTSRTSGHSPVTTTYFTFVSNDPYQAHRLPAGWVLQGQKPSGVPCKKLVTIELPDYIHDANSDLGTHYISEYSTKDGNANKVFFSCNATPFWTALNPQSTPPFKPSRSPHQPHPASARIFPPKFFLSLNCTDTSNRLKNREHPRFQTKGTPYSCLYNSLLFLLKRKLYLPRAERLIKALIFYLYYIPWVASSVNLNA